MVQPPLELNISISTSGPSTRDPDAVDVGAIHPTPDKCTGHLFRKYLSSSLVAEKPKH